MQRMLRYNIQLPEHPKNSRDEEEKSAGCKDGND